MQEVIGGAFKWVNLGDKLYEAEVFVDHVDSSFYLVDAEG